MTHSRFCDKYSIVCGLHTPYNLTTNLFDSITSHELEKFIVIWTHYILVCITIKWYNNWSYKLPPYTNVSAK